MTVSLRYCYEIPQLFFRCIFHFGLDVDRLETKNSDLLIFRIRRTSDSSVVLSLIA